MSWGDALGRELTLSEQLLIQTIGSAGFEKSVTVEVPSNSEDITIFRTNHAITITKVSAVVRGTSSPAIDFNLYHAADRSAAGNAVFSSDETTNSESTPDEFTTFADATIPADSVVWVETSAEVGTVAELHITLSFTIDT